jgi:hypothetical protein
MVDETLMRKLVREIAEQVLDSLQCDVLIVKPSDRPSRMRLFPIPVKINA